MKSCKCGSYAINPGQHGRDDTDLDLCDVCFWRKRATTSAQDREDAERYRYLKARPYSIRAPHIDQEIKAVVHEYGEQPRRIEYPLIRDVGLDQAIDSARKIDTARVAKGADHG